MAASENTSPLRVAVITGGHSYDVPGFHALFRSLPGIDALIQHLDDFASSPPEVRDGYAVLLFYFMPLKAPVDGNPEWFQGNPREALERIGETSQGVVLLHHSLVAYRDWPFWSQLSGVKWSQFDYHIGENVPVEVASPNHPIARGLKPFAIVDETYEMAGAGTGSEVLLATSHPKSMRTIAWTRRHGNASIFCLQLGHDDRAWKDENFREILRRGIQWAAEGPGHS